MSESPPSGRHEEERKKAKDTDQLEKINVTHSDTTETQHHNEKPKYAADKTSPIHEARIVPTSPSTSPCWLGKMNGPLTKRDMEEVRRIGGDDYICVNQVRKTNALVIKKANETIEEFKTMAEQRMKELQSIVFSNKDLAIAVVGKNGCRIGLADGSAYMDIPRDAVDKDTIIYMYKLPEDCEVTGPADDKKIFSFSGLYKCGPEGNTFKKDVILNFEHCAALTDVNDGFAVMGRENEQSPWSKQDPTRFFVIGNRVEHILRGFSDKCAGVEETDEGETPRLRMCLMLAVSRVRRHYVEAVLMRDESSLINEHRINFIDVMGFDPNELHVIHNIAIEPSQHVTFESTIMLNCSEIGPSDWNMRGHYSFIMRTPRAGSIRFNVTQQYQAVPLATIQITERGVVEVEGTSMGQNLQVDEQTLNPFIHAPIPAADFGRQRVQCPDFALPFAINQNLDTYYGNVPSRRREGQIPELVAPHLHQRTESTDSGCPGAGRGEDQGASAGEGSNEMHPAQYLHVVGIDRIASFDSGNASTPPNDSDEGELDAASDHDENQLLPDEESRPQDHEIPKEDAGLVANEAQQEDNEQSARAADDTNMDAEFKHPTLGEYDQSSNGATTLVAAKAKAVIIETDSGSENGEHDQSNGATVGQRSSTNNVTEGKALTVGAAGAGPVITRISENSDDSSSDETQPRPDRVERRRLISTSSCLSEDGLVEEGQDVTAASGGDDEAQTGSQSNLGRMGSSNEEDRN